jgi:ribose transport system ATP-binding protein
MNSAVAPRLEVRDIEKSFPGVRALRKVSLQVFPGEVLSVVGENGAGKSTLMKILAGVHSPDAGLLLVDGQQQQFARVADAMQHGIALIHQELNLADNLDIGANLFLGREPRKFGLIDDQAIRRQSESLLQRIGLKFSPETLVRDLTVGQQQMVEIAKALSINARVLIMDEPTSSLSAAESARLFEVIRDLRQQGVSIVYISHRLAEVQDLSDRAVVLRDGASVGSLQRGQITHDNLVRLMVGRDVSRIFSRSPCPPGQTVLEVHKLRTATWPAHEVSFSIKAGEVVGIAGLVGAGRTELLRTLFGIDTPLSGSITAAGRQLQLRSAQDAIAAGIALVPEDRKQQGVVLDMAIRQNIGLASAHRHSHAGFLSFATEQAQSAEMCGRLRVKSPDDQVRVGNLSGGNQQKVVLGKWLALRPSLLLLDEPTRGIDVGAKQEIYQLMDELAQQGLAVLFVSSELEEILGLSDRVLVMHEGRITGQLHRDALSEQAIMHLATGHFAEQVVQ